MALASAASAFVARVVCHFASAASAFVVASAAAAAIALIPLHLLL
jgi:hypothetical protein